MKKILLFLLITLPLSLMAQSDTTIVVPIPGALPVDGNFLDWLLYLRDNLAVIFGYFIGLLSIVSVFLRSISTKINIDPLTRLMVFLDRILNLIPFIKNRQLGGGTFTLSTRVVGGSDELEVGDEVETISGKRLVVKSVNKDGTYTIK